MTGPQITITYCTQCNWLLRASWLASELLSTFGTDLGAVTLVPGTGSLPDRRRAARRLARRVRL